MKNLFDISDFVDVLTPQAVICNLVERFKKRRKERKITQKDLAKRSGVSYASIRRFETTGEISLSSLLKLANAMDMLDEFETLFSRPFYKNLKDY